MATSCEDVSARMMELLYGELPEGERAAIEAHLQTDGGGCARCRQELASFQSTRAIARRALDETPPARAHQTILRAAAEAAAARSKAPSQRTETTRASFWDRLRARWTLPTLATVGAVAVFLLASRIFLEPQKTYERGRQGLLPAPAEAPAPAVIGPAAVPGQAPTSSPAPEAQPAGHGADAPEGAAPAERARIRATAKGGGSIGLGGLGGLGGFGGFGSTATATATAKRKAAPERLAKEKSDLGRSEEFAQPPSADRADRSFAPPPPPRNVRPAPMPEAYDRELLRGTEESESAGQDEGRGGRLRAGEPKAASAPQTSGPAKPARPAKKTSGGRANDLDGQDAMSAGAAPTGALANAAPPRDQGSGFAAAPAAPPANAPAAAKRERIEQLSADDLDKDEAPAARDKSARKAESPVALADRLFSQGRWAEAAVAYRELLRRDPRNADAARWRQRLAAAESALAPTAAPPR
jgi:anti-sigma factor RsiW